SAPNRGRSPSQNPNPGSTSQRRSSTSSRPCCCRPAKNQNRGRPCFPTSTLPRSRRLQPTSCAFTLVGTRNPARSRQFIQCAALYQLQPARKRQLPRRLKLVMQTQACFRENMGCILPNSSPQSVFSPFWHQRGKGDKALM